MLKEGLTGAAYDGDKLIATVLSKDLFSCSHLKFGPKLDKVLGLLDHGMAQMIKDGKITPVTERYLHFFFGATLPGYGN